MQIGNTSIQISLHGVLMSNFARDHRANFSKFTRYFVLPVLMAALTMYYLYDFAYFSGNWPYCSQYAQTENEAQEAIAIFFSSDTKRPRDLIKQLRKDGMVDEYLLRFQSGCRNCIFYRGELQQFEDPDRWYLSSGIAPHSKKRTVVLRVDCPRRVILDRKLYGG